jgi:hypothetical protein
MMTVTGKEKMDRQEFFRTRVLKVLADTQYKNPYGLTRGPKSRFPEGTLKAWLRKNKPRFPANRALLEFARLTGVSLDYLILGEGPQFRGQLRTTPELADALRGELAIRLVHSGVDGEVLPQGIVEPLLPDGETILHDAFQQQLQRLKNSLEDRMAGAREVLRSGLLSRLVSEPDEARRRKFARSIRHPFRQVTLDIRDVTPNGKQPLEVEQSRVIGDKRFGQRVEPPIGSKPVSRESSARSMSLAELRKVLKEDPGSLDRLADAEFERQEGRGPRKAVLRLLLKSAKTLEAGKKPEESYLTNELTAALENLDDAVADPPPWHTPPEETLTTEEAST